MYVYVYVRGCLELSFLLLFSLLLSFPVKSLHFTGGLLCQVLDEVVHLPATLLTQNDLFHFG